jgi:RHS repeat-associated protein
VDVDRGTWSFVPNALGELTSQTDAKGQTTSFAYDKLGRPTSRSEAEGTATWTWGTSSTARNIGRLQSVSGPGYSESLTYDALGRLASRSVTSDATYLFDWTYNTLGLPDTLTYPTSTAGVRFKVKYAYAGGYLASIQDDTGNVLGPVLWNLNLLDARGNAVSESYANGLWLQQGYEPLTGLALTRKAGTGGLDDNVQDLAYTWDDGANLTSRQDLRQGLTESFTYDALDRLTGTSGPGGTSLSLVYNALGNLTSRSDVGSYSYHATKKHAVIAAGSNTYAYDANGNLVTRNGVTQSWTSSNLPAGLSAGGYSAQFAYAPDRSRWRQVSTYAGGTETTIYVGGMLEKLTTAVRTHWKHRIPTPSGEVQVIRRSDGTNETLYLTTDHLGSTDTVVNASGAVLARTSFTAWGARRGSGWTGTPSSAEWQAIADTTRRGYTGHEALDNVLLVHMNGRVYDPAIGRFMSADPYVDGAGSSQGWNRYAYVRNNPLKYTDPSGYALHLAWGSGGRTQRIDPGYQGGSVGGMSSGGPGAAGGLEEIIVTGSSYDPSQAMANAWAQLVFRDLLSGGGAFGYAADGTPEVTVTASRINPPTPPRPAMQPMSLPQGQQPIKNWLCEAGNSVADGADGLGNVSGQLLLAGLGIAGVGFVTAQPAITGPGLALAATGGLGNIGAGALQLGAGLLQGAGGGGFSNSGYAALSLATGFTLARGITGPAIGGYRTVSQRAGDAFRNGTATVAGGVNNAWTSLIDAAAPRQVSCPGGN